MIAVVIKWNVIHYNYGLCFDMIVIFILASGVLHCISKERRQYMHNGETPGTASCHMWHVPYHIKGQGRFCDTNTMAEKLVQEGLPRGLLFRPEHSSLLVFSSNTSAQSNGRPKCDEDARKIVSTMNSGGIINSSHTALITTSSASCTKRGLEGAIEDQISKVVPDEDGLFILVYCGGACELREATRVSEPCL